MLSHQFTFENDCPARPVADKTPSIGDEHKERIVVVNERVLIAYRLVVDEPREATSRSSAVHAALEVKDVVFFVVAQRTSTGRLHQTDDWILMADFCIDTEIERRKHSQELIISEFNLENDEPLCRHPFDRAPGASRKFD